MVFPRTGICLIGVMATTLALASGQVGGKTEPVQDPPLTAAPQNPSSLPPLPPFPPVIKKSADGTTPETPNPYTLPHGPNAPGLPPAPGQIPPDKFVLPPLDKDLAVKDLPREQATGPIDDSPSGRQEPAVSLEWVGPPVSKIGQQVNYQIMVKNTSAARVRDVVVRCLVSGGIAVQSTQPKAQSNGPALIWEVGALEPRQERRLEMRLEPKQKGDLACQASVTFTGSSMTHLKVREPKLAIKATSPGKVVLNDVANFKFTVSNPGDASADQVRVRAKVSDGLVHPNGKILEFDLGNLGPNETRDILLVCFTKAGGMQHCDVSALGEGNLRAEDSAPVEVIVPRLDLVVKGPPLRYLGRPATYLFKVTNAGSAAASNVMVAHQVPSGFKFMTASAGGKFDPSIMMVSWFIGELAPGQSRDVTMEVLANSPGTHKLKAIVEASRGLRNEAEATTRVEAVSVLEMAVVDQDDPVEIGVDTFYKIEVTNKGSRTEKNLRLVCTIPEKMEFRGAKGAGDCPCHLQGRDLVFEPLPQLAPSANVVYRVNVRGIAAGDLRFQARVMADGMTSPVLKEESTKVYGDTVAPP